MGFGGDMEEKGSFFSPLPLYVSIKQTALILCIFQNILSTWRFPKLTACIQTIRPVTAGSQVWILVLTGNIVSVWSAAGVVDSVRDAHEEETVTWSPSSCFCSFPIVFIMLLSTKWRGDTLCFSLISTFHHPVVANLWPESLSPSCTDVKSLNRVKLKLQTHGNPQN